MLTKARLATAQEPSLAAESDCWARGLSCVAGIDEVGRGAWAGPVVAAAVVLPQTPSIAVALADVRDSKMLSPRQRERLDELIRSHAIAVGVGMVDPQIVDTQGLLPATACAMNDAIANLCLCPDHVLVDGLRMTGLSHAHTPIVRGDASCLSIAAASVVAKVARDRLMARLDTLHPGYSFGEHKGYGTTAHRDALCRLGPCPAHRHSYAPVAAIAAQSWA